MSTGTLDQRVTALEQLVAGLQGSEALQPNYLTVTPGGLVGANFTGKLNASGVILPVYVVGSSQIVQDHAVIWTDPANGNIQAGGISVERQAAGGIGGVNATFTVIDADAETSADESQTNIRATDDTSTVQASLNVTQYGRGNGSVNAFAGAQARTILDSNGNSSFPQLVSSNAIYIDGPYTISCPSLAAGASNTVTINGARTSYNNSVMIGGFNAFLGYVPSFGCQYIGGNQWIFWTINNGSHTTQACNWVGYIMGT